MDLNQRLNKETSLHNSGKLYNGKRILSLREKDYFVVPDIKLDGEAPKSFIKVYKFIKGSGIKRSNPNTWIPYIAKTGEKWYPHESLIEYIINRIGQAMGLNMNEVALFRINNQIRFLSKYFINNKTQTLTHGAEICGEYLDDKDLASQIAADKQTSRQLFTFEFITKAINHKFSADAHNIILDIVKMITFDALVGNNDRHFYNWAVIVSTKKNIYKPHLAPIYDSARALLWNHSEEKIAKIKHHQMSNGKQFDRYIFEACPRISIEGDEKINHFRLVGWLKQQGYSQTINALCSPKSEEAALSILQNEFIPLVSKTRGAMTLDILKRRFKLNREI